jgi:hypothetical protein
MVLVATLVTPEAPSTAKVAKSLPSIGAANPWEGPQRSAANAATANRIKNLFIPLEILLIDFSFLLVVWFGF